VAYCEKGHFTVRPASRSTISQRRYASWYNSATGMYESPDREIHKKWYCPGCKKWLHEDLIEEKDVLTGGKTMPTYEFNESGKAIRKKMTLPKIEYTEKEYYEIPF
jgi:hypothetical protein